MFLGIFPIPISYGRTGNLDNLDVSRESTFWFEYRTSLELVVLL